MTAFKDDAPLRLSLPWTPPVNVDASAWGATLGDRVEDADLYRLLGHFNHYDVTHDQIHFYMKPTMKKAALKKALRHDQKWAAFKRDNPEVRLTWADDLQGQE
jgi:hypothetical protein